MSAKYVTTTDRISSETNSVEFFDVLLDYSLNLVPLHRLEIVVIERGPEHVK